MDAFFHTLSRQRLFPEAMLRICPGYLPADDAEPVARARRFAPPPGAVCDAANFPEAMLHISKSYRCKKACSLSRLLNLVGDRGFEPPTPSSRTKCATRLRQSPNAGASYCCDTHPSMPYYEKVAQAARNSPLRYGFFAAASGTWHQLLYWLIPPSGEV